MLRCLFAAAAQPIGSGRPLSRICRGMQDEGNATDVTRICALLGGAASSRHDAYSELSRLAATTDGTGAAVAGHWQARSTAISLAAACVGPLIDSVICADRADVNARESRQAHILLAELLLLDPLRVGHPLVANDRWLWASHTGYRPAKEEVEGGDFRGSAYTDMIARASSDPSSITPDDVRLAACEVVTHLVVFSSSFSAFAESEGLDEMAAIDAFFATMPFLVALSPTDDMNLRVTLLALDIARDPPEDMCGLERAGLWFLLFWTIGTRATVLKAALDSGLMQLAMAALRQSSADEWIKQRSPAGLQAGAIMMVFRELGNSGVPEFNPLKALIDSGAADVVGAVLQAYEQAGAGAAAEANPLTVVHVFQILEAIDLTTPEARPVLTLLQAIAPALQFAIDNPSVHCRALGLTSAGLCSVLCSVLFGKEEGSESLSLTKDSVFETVVYLQSAFSGPNYHFLCVHPACPPALTLHHYAHALVSMQCAVEALAALHQPSVRLGPAQDHPHTGAWPLITMHD